MANLKTITLEQLFRFNRGLPHQLAAISELEADIKDNGYEAAMRRDRPWFSTWSQDGKQSDAGSALALIREFEGCRLQAYPDPGTGGDPWTIGWGSTRHPDGTPVKRGDRISQVVADQMLAAEVEQKCIPALAKSIPGWADMSQRQQAALISFAWNCGWGFYGAPGFETLSRRLRDRDWSRVPEAMALYVNPGSNVEAGLRRRRAAEGLLWVSGAQAAADQPPQATPSAARLQPGDSFSTKVTPHITYGEIALNQETRRFVAQYQCDTAVELAQFLEKVRSQFGGKSLTITSGYRPPAINRAVGGASSSEHLYDAPSVGAVDFLVEGVDIYAVQDWCDKNWPYSLGYGAPKGFVHLGIRQGRPRVRWVY